ncbi:MFS transporter [Variovorax ginsengisoli]|uniref:MFS family arabinose efflux permease n=1 Tax=Variovorax ginsengisoli TaxID=363844 RepID=A0ABT9S922_9BURK|nr:MFS transporter [Variovorax ginsengisoli]MDP9900846.1 putative MFS family arabinose efflux permease [Variovorax ginsengisoli]
MTQRHEIHAAALVTALVVGSMALLVLGLQPILLGELLEAKKVSLEGLGLVAMAEIVALGLGALLGDLALPLAHLRLATAVAAAATAALNLGTLYAMGDAGFAACRAAAGLAEGVLVWGATAVIVRSASPDRIAGIFFVLQTVAQAVVGLALAHVVIPAHGWAGAFTLLASLLVVPVLLAPALPRNLQPLSTPSTGVFAWSWEKAMPLITVFLQLSALGALWAYIEPLGIEVGFSGTAVQTLIAACLGIQVVGGLCGSVLVRSLDAPRALLVGSALLCGVAIGIFYTGVGVTPMFAALCGLFAFIWLFITPFQMRFAFSADTSGRVASLIPAAQIFGIACGPLIASAFVQGEQAHAVPVVSAAFGAAAVLTLCLRFVAQRQLRFDQRLER